jgi:hypothetical protein
LGLIHEVETSTNLAEADGNVPDHPNWVKMRFSVRGTGWQFWQVRYDVVVRPIEAAVAEFGRILQFMSDFAMIPR